MKIPARVLPKILSFHFPENVNYCDARNDVSQAPDDESVQRAPLLSQVVVVAVQHEAVPVPPGGFIILTSMTMLFHYPSTIVVHSHLEKRGKEKGIGETGVVNVTVSTAPHSLTISSSSFFCQKIGHFPKR